MKKKVLISGAGPAGLATALLLDTEKFDIQMIERSDDFNSMGFSIILWKTGYEVLQNALGSDPDFVSPINTMTILGGSEYEELQSADMTGLTYSVERDMLIKNLSSAFMKKFGEHSIKFNTRITEIQESEGSARVTVSGRDTSEYDLVICADGMHSDIRTKHFSANLESGPYKIVYQWVKPGSMLHETSIVGFMTDVTYLIQTTGDKALLAYYTESDETLGNEFEANLTQMMQDRYGGSFEIDHGTRAIFGSEEAEVKSWHKNSIVLIGDAAHGHPPTLAAGTSMALEDAALISDLLDHNDIDIALHAYSERRKKRIHSVYQLQHLIEEMGISHNDVHTQLSKLAGRYAGQFILQYLKHLVRQTK